MPTYADAINDLVLAVVEDHWTLGKDGYSDLALNFPDMWVAGRWLKTKKKKAGSHAITWRVKIANSGNYRGNVGLYDTDQPARQDIFKEGSVNWTGLNVGIHYDIEEEAFMSPGRSVKVDYIKAQIDSAYQEFMEGLSIDLWSYPSSSSVRGILGFPYWLRPSSTAAFGFNAGQVYSSDTIGGIDQSTYTRWKNGTGTFTSLSDEDGLDKLSQAMDECNFRSMGATIGSPDDRNAENIYDLCTTYNNIQEYERYVRTQNDNVGSDAGAFRGGNRVFRSTPMKHVWELSKSTQGDGSANPAYDSTDPIYGINWRTFTCAYIGKEMRRTGPRQAPNQRDVRRIDLDSKRQNICTDRRKNFVLTRA